MNRMLCLQSSLTWLALADVSLRVYAFCRMYVTLFPFSHSHGEETAACGMSCVALIMRRTWLWVLADPSGSGTDAAAWPEWPLKLLLCYLRLGIAKPLTSNARYRAAQRSDIDLLGEVRWYVDGRVVVSTSVLKSVVPLELIEASPSLSLR